jgi:hypothetical protein
MMARDEFMKTKRWIVLPAVLGIAFIIASCAKKDNPVERQAAFGTIKGFYMWALEHGKQVEALQPVIKDIPHSDRFYLDTSQLDGFAKQFLESGFFAPEFETVVKKYYERYKAQFEALPQTEFADLKKSGRGPMMEVEDMDIFFCAQEYDYTRAFVEKMAIKSFRMSGDQAEVVVISPYQWETNFSMVKRQGRWLISRYCVFQ